MKFLYELHLLCGDWDKHKNTHILKHGGEAPGGGSDDGELTFGKGRERAKQTEKKITEDTDELAEDYEEIEDNDYFDTAIRDTFNQLTGVLDQHKASGDYTRKEQETFHRQIDERLIQRKDHLNRVAEEYATQKAIEKAEAAAAEATIDEDEPDDPTATAEATAPAPPPTVEAATESFEMIEVSGVGWMEDIADTHGITVDSIKETNPGKIYKVTAELAEKSSAWVEGNHYSTANPIQIRVPKAAPTDPVDVAPPPPTVAQQRTEAKMDFYEEQDQALAEVDDQAWEAYKAEILGNSDLALAKENLKGRKENLPEFLRKMDANDWDELIRRAVTAEDSQSQRIMSVVQDMGWEPVDLRNAIRRGNNTKLSFNDMITQHAQTSGLFEVSNQTQFFSLYEATLVELAGYEKGSGNPNGVEMENLEIKKRVRSIAYSGQLKNAFVAGNLDAENPIPQKERQARIDEYERGENEELSEWKTRIDDLEPQGKGEEKAQEYALEYYNRVRSIEDQLGTVQGRKALLVQKIRQYEDFMGQCQRMFDAMGSATQGVELQAKTEFDQYMESARELAPRSDEPDATIYDFNSLLEGDAKKARGENIEGIFVNADTLGTASTLIQGIDSRIPERKIKEDFILELSVAAYGMDYLIKNECVVKVGNYLALNKLPDNFTAENENLQAVIQNVGETFYEEGWSLKFNDQLTETMKLQTLHNEAVETEDAAWDGNDYEELDIEGFEDAEDLEEFYAESLIDSAFQPVDKAHSMTLADASDHRGLIYNHTGQLTRRFNPDVAGQWVIEQNSTYNTETKEYDLDQEAVLEDLAFYLEQGVLNYFMDPNLDIVEEFENVGIELTGDEKQTLRQTNRKIGRLSAKVRRKQEKAQRLEEDIQRLDENDKPDKEAKKAIKREELNKLLFGTQDEPGLHAEMKELKETVHNMFTETNGGTSYLERFMGKLDLELDEGSAGLTDQQRRFIQNGFVFAENVERGMEDDMEKHSILEAYKGQNPAAAYYLELIYNADTAGDLSPDEFAYAAEQIVNGLNSLEYRPVTEIQTEMAHNPDNLPVSKDLAFGLVGQTGATYVDDNFDHMNAVVVGAFMSLPIRNRAGNTLFTLSIGVKAGYTDEMGHGADAGIGISRELVSADAGQVHMSLTGSVMVGAGATTKKGVHVGAIASLTASIGTEDVAVFGSVGAGARIDTSTGDVVTGISYGGGIKFAPMPETQLRRARDNASAEGLKGYVDQAESPDERVKRIAELPGFSDMEAQFSSHLGRELPPNSRDAMLNDAYEFYIQELENAGEANKVIWPITGVSIASIFGIPVPIIHFHIRGRTRVYPMTANGNTLNELSKGTGGDIEAQLASQMNGEVAPALDAGNLDNLPSVAQGYNEHGDIYVMPAERSETTVGAEIMQGRNEAHNDMLRESGMELLPVEEGTAEGLLQLNVYGQTEGEEIQVIMDPALRAEMYVGSSPDQMYLAFNQGFGGLIITRETFYLTRTQNDVNNVYKKTVITIKENPLRHFNDFENPGMVEFLGNGTNVNPVEGDNVHKLGKLAEQRAGLEELGWLSPLAKEDADATADAMETAGEGGVDYDTLTPLADSFFDKHSQLVLDALTQERDEGDAEHNAEFTALLEMIKTEYPGYAEDGAAIGYFVNRLYEVSYVSVPDENKEQFAKAHRSFFERVLTTELGNATFASQLMDDLEIDNIDTDSPTRIPASASTYTVVGRKGVVGLRDQAVGTNEVYNAKMYSPDSEMGKAIIAATNSETLPDPDGGLPQKREFLHNNLSLNTYAMYLIMKGPEAKKVMDKIYQDPSLITDTEQPQYGEAFAEFQAIVERFKVAEFAARPADQFVSVKDKDGIPQLYAVETQVLAGVRAECANPALAVNARIIPVGMRAAAMAEAYQESDYKVQTEVVDILVGFSHSREDETTVIEEDDAEMDEGGDGNEDDADGGDDGDGDGDGGEGGGDGSGDDGSQDPPEEGDDAGGDDDSGGPPDMP